jgi:ESS family glutamate:Na+ symporter
MIDTLRSTLPLFGLALGLLLALLAVGTLLGKLLGMHRWGIPEALLAGSLGLLIAPTGALPLIPPAVISLWDQLPLILLTLVFASLLLGKPLPALGGLWRPLSAQVLMALTLAFGQYVVAGLAVLLVLQPLLGAPDVMACLIEVAFEGGHGSAAAMGPTYARLGLQSGEALGLAMATVGLLASTLVGGLVVVVARRQRWLLSDGLGGTEASALAGGASLPLPAQPLPAQPQSSESLPAQPRPSVPRPTESRTSEPKPVELQASSSAPATPAPIALGAVNLALNGVAVAIGWGMLEGLRLVAENQGGGFAMVIEALPVFPLALVGSLLVRLVLERSGNASVASGPIQGLVATLAADLLITSATACLDLSLLAQDWIPLTALAVAGLVWNLGVVLLLGPRILPAPWFERGILEFGQATGVAASGLLLLRMADPNDQSDALPAFSIKQLLLQPLIAGGVITVVAPLVVTRLGLPLWSGLCLMLVLLWIGLALILARRFSSESQAS